MFQEVGLSLTILIEFNVNFYLFCLSSVTINREMRNLIQSLQNHNQQLKMEAGRYKRRLRESQAETHKVNTF